MGDTAAELYFSTALRLSVYSSALKTSREGPLLTDEDDYAEWICDNRHEPGHD